MCFRRTWSMLAHVCLNFRHLLWFQRRVSPEVARLHEALGCQEKQPHRNFTPSRVTCQNKISLHISTQSPPELPWCRQRVDPGPCPHDFPERPEPTPPRMHAQLPSYYADKTSAKCYSCTAFLLALVSVFCKTLSRHHSTSTHTFLNPLAAVQNLRISGA